MRFTLPILLLMFCAATTFGQGSGFTYQGRLLDGAQPGEGRYDLTFRLYDAAAGGAQVGEAQTRSQVLLEQGCFGVELDFGAAAFGGGERWLEIGVRRSGSGDDYMVMHPRQGVRSVPYAVRAATAATFHGAVSDAQLSTNVARLNGDQAFGGRVEFASAVGTFAGDGSGLTNVNGVASVGMGMFAGRVNQLPSSAGTFYGAVSGVSEPASAAGQVSMLSPGQAGTAGDLSVRVWPAPGSGQGLEFVLVVNGVETGVRCGVSGSSVAANSGGQTAVVPAGAELALKVIATGASQSASAMFGWRLR